MGACLGVGWPAPVAKPVKGIGSPADERISPALRPHYPQRPLTPKPGSVHVAKAPDASAQALQSRPSPKPLQPAMHPVCIAPKGQTVADVVKCLHRVCEEMGGNFHPQYTLAQNCVRCASP